MARHRHAGRQLRRTSEQRLALLRNLATSLIENGSIVFDPGAQSPVAFAKPMKPNLVAAGGVISEETK